MQVNIAQRLKNLRIQNRYSQEKVASYCGMTSSRYGHYETGRAFPSIETLIALCEYYGFSTLDELLGIADEKKVKHNKIVLAYHSVDAEKRKIVDFILNLNQFKSETV